MASALYPCIKQMEEMYDYNKSCRTGLCSDYMIYSPKVPIIRNDNYVFLDKPEYASFITAPAVNAGIVRDKKSNENIAKIDSTMVGRIEKILLGVLYEHEVIVLGAYGCEVFKNNPTDVTKYFKGVLIKEPFRNYYKKIVFAIYDKSPLKENFKVFKNTLLK